jgi:hypothetical protein
MSRISRLQRDEVQGESLVIYDRVLRDQGNVPNMFRTMAHMDAEELAAAILVTA